MRNVWLGLTVAVLLAGCGDGDEIANIAGRKVRVVATIGMIADAAQNVGGERVEVTALMGPGVDPHTYKATAGDVRRMEQADLVLYNGLHLEGQMAELFGRLRRTTAVALAERLDPDKDLRKATEGFEGTYDPHVWFDVRLWMKVVEATRDVLIEKDPDHASVYQENAKAYLGRLTDLDAYVRKQAARVPSDQRVLITAHDAFHYFGRAYGFEVRGLQGISTATEASINDVEALAEVITRRRIPAIFVESSVNEKNLKAVQEAVQSKGFRVKIGGELFSDAMGDPGTREGTYEGMVRHNIDTIVEALTQ
jgi:manganese/zinc/iron transport system substrate-binding protein